MLKLTKKLAAEGGPGTQRQVSGRDENAPSLSLLHFQGILYILGIVWVASGVVLLLEVLAHRYKHSTVACRSMSSK